jgi:hypothetical protein
MVLFVLWPICFETDGDAVACTMTSALQRDCLVPWVLGAFAERGALCENAR